jgi:hypothetical protein
VHLLDNPIIHWAVSRLAKTGVTLIDDVIKAFKSEEDIRALGPNEAVTLPDVKFSYAGNSYTDSTTVTRDPA